LSSTTQLDEVKAILELKIELEVEFELEEKQVEMEMEIEFEKSEKKVAASLWKELMLLQKFNRTSRRKPPEIKFVEPDFKINGTYLRSVLIVYSCCALCARGTKARATD